MTLIKSMWLEDALKDDRLRKAIFRLRLKEGEFSRLASIAELPDDQRLFTGKVCSKTRMFFSEGPLGGISGILLATRFRRLVRIGVYVDRKRRRQKIATRLVEAAREHYPATPLRGDAWSDASLNFWNKVVPLTRRGPATFFLGD